MPAPDSIWTESDVNDLRREFEPVYGGRTVLVTGADGFMGSHLTEALVCSARASTPSCARPRAAR